MLRMFSNLGSDQPSLELLTDITNIQVAIFIKLSPLVKQQLIRLILLKLVPFELLELFIRIFIQQYHNRRYVMLRIITIKDLHCI